MKTIVVGACVSLGLSVAATGAVAVPAPAASYCTGTSYAGTCYTTTRSGESSTVVETIPLSNTSMFDVTMWCAFGQTFTKTMTATRASGGSAPSSLMAGILASVDAVVDLPLARSISQSAAQVTPGSSTFLVLPGQEVSCNRLYTEVTATVEVTSYSGGATSDVGTYATTIPSGFWFEAR